LPIFLSDCEIHLHVDLCRSEMYPSRVSVRSSRTVVASSQLQHHIHRILVISIARGTQ
jgi:hypothetical protein